MDARSIADCVLSMENTRRRLDESIAALMNAVADSGKIVRRTVDNSMTGRPRSDLPNDLFFLVTSMYGAVGDKRSAMLASVEADIRRLRAQLWKTPTVIDILSEESSMGDTGGRAGHLRNFTDSGEPQVPSEVRYESAPLRTPTVIDIDVAKQGNLGDCYLIAAINGVAAWKPGTFAGMVEVDPQKSDFVIVRVHGGTYRLRATLPVDVNTGRPIYCTSSDASNFAQYVEKAAAAHMGAWEDLWGGNPHLIATWLLGCETRLGQSWCMSDSEILGAVSAPMGFVTVPANSSGTRARDLRRKRLVLADGHCYTIAGVTGDNLVRLRNPLGEFHPALVSVEDLRVADVDLAWVDDRSEPASAGNTSGGASQ